MPRKQQRLAAKARREYEAKARDEALASAAKERAVKMFGLSTVLSGIDLESDHPTNKQATTSGATGSNPSANRESADTSAVQPGSWVPATAQPEPLAQQTNQEIQALLLATLPPRTLYQKKHQYHTGPAMTRKMERADWTGVAAKVRAVYRDAMTFDRKNLPFWTLDEWLGLWHRWSLAEEGEATEIPMDSALYHAWWRSLGDDGER